MKKNKLSKIGIRTLIITIICLAIMFALSATFKKVYAFGENEFTIKGTERKINDFWALTDWAEEYHVSTKHPDSGYGCMQQDGVSSGKAKTAVIGRDALGIASIALYNNGYGGEVYTTKFDIADNYRNFFNTILQKPQFANNKVTVDTIRKYYDANDDTRLGKC